MDRFSGQSAVLPEDWPAVLANIQQALTKALEEAGQRETAFESGKSAPDAVAAPPNLEQVDQWLLAFQSCFQQAEQEAAEVETALQEGEDALHYWQALAELFGQRLGKKVGASL